MLGLGKHEKEPGKDQIVHSDSLVDAVEGLCKKTSAVLEQLTIRGDPRVPKYFDERRKFLQLMQNRQFNKFRGSGRSELHNIQIVDGEIVLFEDEDSGTQSPKRFSVDPLDPAQVIYLVNVGSQLGTLMRDWQDKEKLSQRHWIRQRMEVFMKDLLKTDQRGQQ